MKKICFLAQFPPPMHGLSKAVDTLYNSELQKDFAFEAVNLTENRKFLQNLRKIRKSQADLFYFTISQTKGGNLRDLWILKLLQRQGKKCLLHLHGGYYRTLLEKDLPKWQKQWNANALSKVEGAIVLGPSLCWIFEGLVPQEKIYTVANCIDDAFLLSETELEQKLSGLSHKNVYHILYLSNFIASKGYPELLDLAKLEKLRVEQGGKARFHFDFAGAFFEESEKEFFFRFIEENQLQNYVTYHGVVGGEEKKKLLKDCDIFALLTRYPREGQPISILEAMGNGMPILTTNHAGIPDVVVQGENGILLDANSLDMQECLQQLLALDSEKLQKMAVVNYRKVKEQFSQKNYIQNMKDIFKSI